ncbi:MAG: tRNA 4-thiouridine(8) synthase ThiI [Candidatus Marsarchaeota archaeon]|jgi:thiamine biosynthesis protein ThiI|nr:tRNA 4-thiouridine(8) synthase ThiI [Candidatus Marsarchaeota archaeon]MCL5115352.1 tRNA 4-thiouridine(8) synthase ThiI [Candidatus Marsarchaeota archaeon]
MKKYDAVVVHFGEIWLKGRNRGAFIQRLIHNIERNLHGLSPKIANKRDRLLLYFEGSKELSNSLDRLQYVFGISWFGPVKIAKNAPDDILKAANSILSKNETVRLEANRSYKEVPFNSREIINLFIRSKNRKFNVDINSAHTMNISVIKDFTILCADKHNGAGGLPTGSSGKAIVLLSGGIDSPVAAVYAMKRGLDAVYLHVHAFDTNKKASSSKMRVLLEKLSRYGPAPIYYAPSYLFQSATIKIPAKYELVLFRKFLFRLAEEIAEKENADAIVTGESLGQVASQTIPNMTAAQQGIKPIIIRPLIGFDKAEIIDKAKSIGTYEISIKEYKDVCSIGVKNPSTAMDASTVNRLYADCKLDQVLKRTLALAELQNGDQSFRNLSKSGV